MITAVYQILFANAVPEGYDSDAYVLNVLRILQEGKVLIPYSQFLDLNANAADLGYYPSLLQILLAVQVKLLSGYFVDVQSVIFVMSSFMFAVYLGGIIGFALFIKTLLDRILPLEDTREQLIIRYALLALAFGIFIYATGPVIKTFRDAGYGEIFAAWGIMPFYLYALLKGHWRVSAVLLAMIAASHNISFIIATLATIPFFANYFAVNRFRNVKKIGLAFGIFAALFVPSFIFFYAPALQHVAEAKSGSTGPGYTFEGVRVDLTDGLVFIGIGSTVLLIVLEPRKYAWLSIWVALYMLFITSSLFAERFVREWSIPLGIAGGVLSVILISNYLLKRFAPTVKRAIIVLTIACLIIPISYSYYKERIDAYSDSVILDMYSPAFQDLNTYFLDKDLDPNTVIVTYGKTSYFKAFMYTRANVIETLPLGYNPYLSEEDRELNSQFHEIVLHPGSDAAKSVIEKYNVRYLVVSGIIPDRWYSPVFQQEPIQIVSELHPENHYRLEKIIQGPQQEAVWIYEVSPR